MDSLIGWFAAGRQRLSVKFTLLFLGTLFLTLGAGYWFFVREFTAQMKQYARDYGADVAERYTEDIQQVLEASYEPGTRVPGAVLRQPGVKAAVLEATAGLTVARDILYVRLTDDSGATVLETGRLDLLETEAPAVPKQPGITTETRERFLPVHDQQLLDIYRPVSLVEQSASPEDFLFGREPAEGAGGLVGIARIGVDLTVVYDQIRSTTYWIGMLAAGVAHEINNPIGFISSNLHTLTEYFQVITAVLEHYDGLRAGVIDGRRNPDADMQAALQRLAEIQQAEDWAYILDDVPVLLAESAEGVTRVKEIVQGLKSFARLDESEYKDVNINDCIETTLKVVWNELKYKATVRKELSNLPDIHCNAGQLNQVFMNLLVNAAQAITEQGEIRIATDYRDHDVIVRISDTGAGIPRKHVSRIFDPFFTTKPVGTGTGLGLAISYGIIQKHGGAISVDSEPGRGTTFTIRLPVEHSA